MGSGDSVEYNNALEHRQQVSRTLAEYYVKHQQEALHDYVPSKMKKGAPEQQPEPDELKSSVSRSLYQPGSEDRTNPHFVIDGESQSISPIQKRRTRKHHKRRSHKTNDDAVDQTD